MKPIKRLPRVTRGRDPRLRVGGRAPRSARRTVSPRPRTAGPRDRLPPPRPTPPSPPLRRLPRARVSTPSRRRKSSRTPTASRPCGRQGDFVSRGTLIILVIMSMGSWYIMFVKVYEQAKIFRQYGEGAGQVLERRLDPGRHPAAEGRHALPLHRRKRHQGDAAPRGQAPRADRPQHLGHDVDPARRRKRVLAPAGRPRVPRDGRLDRAVRRPVRHGVGHLPRADRHRHRRRRPRSTRSRARWARRSS